MKMTFKEWLKEGITPTEETRAEMMKRHDNEKKMMDDNPNNDKMAQQQRLKSLTIQYRNEKDPVRKRAISDEIGNIKQQMSGR